MNRAFYLVDQAGGLWKLAPPVIQMVRVHRSIRARRHRTHRRRHQPQQAPRASETSFQERKPPTLRAGLGKSWPDRSVLGMSDSLVSFGNAVSSSVTTYHRPARFG